MMRKAMRCAAAALTLLFALTAALPVFAEAYAVESTEAEAVAEATAAPSAAGLGEMVYIGEVSTNVDGTWDCATSFAVKSNATKNYDTMVGNILSLTVYSTVPQDAESNFYLPMDSHITYVDGTDRFELTGRSGEYYCYKKSIRITAAGTFDLTVANTNRTLYSGLYDTLTITAYDTIESMAFFVQQSAGNSSVTDFLVTANGSSTAVITTDTTGFNASDNEWKIVTAEKTEKVLFPGTTYAGYTFEPQTISLAITADEIAKQNPTSIEVYYLGLINGKLFTVGPYTFPASQNTYSSTFELERRRMDVLATEGQITFNAYINGGRTPDITVTDANGISTLQGVQTVESDWEGMEKLAITVSLSDTANDLDLLVGNRWSVNQIAYNYRTLHITFLRDIQNLTVTAVQEGHYHVEYSAAVNGQSDLDTGAVNWYVNGTLQNEHGLTLTRDYTQGGTYAVYAELGGLTSNTVQNVIIHSSAQAVFWYVLAAAVLVCGILMLRHHLNSRGVRRDSVLRARVAALQKAADSAHGALTAGKATPHQAKAALRRLDRRLIAVCDGLDTRAEETNLQSYKEAAAAARRTQQLARTAAHGKTNDLYYLRAAVSTVCHGLRDTQKLLDELKALVGG